MAKFTCPGCKQAVDLPQLPPLFPEIPRTCGRVPDLRAGEAGWPLIRWRNDSELQSFAKKHGLQPAPLQAWYNQFYGVVHCPACYKELAEVAQARQRVRTDDGVATKVAGQSRAIHPAPEQDRAARVLPFLEITLELTGFASLVSYWRGWGSPRVPEALLALALGLMLVYFVLLARVTSRRRRARAGVHELLEKLYASPTGDP